MACEFAPELELPTVHIDNLTSAFEAVNYLTQLGHKRIAQISGPQHAALCQFRHQGYQQALRRAGITMNRLTALLAISLLKPGQKRCVSCWHCLSSRPRFSVITIRWRLAQFRKRSDLACAYRKISLWSVLTIFSLPVLRSPLTTISQPRYEIGRQAMLMMLELLRGHDVRAGSRLLETKLVVRESAAPPSKK